MRAVVLAGALLGALTLPVLAGEVEPREPPSGSYRYDIVHDKHGKIGTQTVTIRRNGERFEVEVERRIEVKAALITLHRERTRTQELWEQDRLVAYRRDSQGGGGPPSLSVMRQGEALVATTPDGSWSLPVDAVPTSVWNPVAVLHDRLFDGGTGQLLSAVTRLEGREPFALNGQAVEMARYETTGDLTRTLWFDAEGRLVRQVLVRDGNRISLVLR